MCETFLLRWTRAKKQMGQIGHENMNDDWYDFLTIFECFLPPETFLSLNYFTYQQLLTN